MYLKYVSNASSVQADVIADLAKLLSGADISTLSASCDKVNTVVIANTLAPGWSLVDTAAPASGCVVSAPDIDGKTTKFFRLYSGSATVLLHDAYETWNATAHTGTNQATPTSLQSLAYSATVANTYYMVVEPRFYAIGAPTGPSLVAAEVTRDIPFLAQTTYPVAVLTDSSFSGSSTTNPIAYMPRVKAMGANGDLTGSANTGVSIAPPTIMGLRTSYLRDNTEAPYHPIYPMFVTGKDALAIFGRLVNMWYSTTSYGAAWDEVSDGTDTYIVIATGANSARVLVKKA